MGSTETRDRGRNSVPDVPAQEFELFKSSVKHHIKTAGQIEFIRGTLLSGRIEELWDEKQWLQALYLLAMTDYLSELNGVPLYTGYAHLRSQKMKEKIYPLSVTVTASLLGKSEDELTADALPEFLKYNIVEGDIFNVR